MFSRVEVRFFWKTIPEVAFTNYNLLFVVVIVATLNSVKAPLSHSSFEVNMVVVLRLHYSIHKAKQPQSMMMSPPCMTVGTVFFQFERITPTL